MARDPAAALSLGAVVLAALATTISAIDGDSDLVPFFAVLTVAGGVVVWATRPPFAGTRRLAARGLAVAWVVVGVWIGGLLITYQAACGCSTAAPIAPEATYVGLPATAYHLAAMYVGGALVVVAAFGGWRGRA